MVLIRHEHLGARSSFVRKKDAIRPYSQTKYFAYAFLNSKYIVDTFISVCGLLTENIENEIRGVFHEATFDHFCFLY